MLFFQLRSLRTTCTSTIAYSERLKLTNSSHSVLNLVKYELIESDPRERRAISFCSSNCLGVLPYESLFLRSIHKSLVVLIYITLALRSMLRELVNHESTVVLHLLQELYNGKEGSSCGIEPFTKPNLFLELKAKNIDLA